MDHDPHPVRVHRVRDREPPVGVQVVRGVDVNGVSKAEALEVGEVTVNNYWSGTNLGTVVFESNLLHPDFKRIGEIANELRNSGHGAMSLSRTSTFAGGK
ncbi:hypothetical protein RH831_10590 [Halodesulfurarchaeum sp. HSR-GB]|uniref:hypothetical protein n=1 Tax=Halodesulfurarchaeum sp. HSR-GB TaxID=3074077 RepID=UPI00286444CB|nr:hypothetical protein [Halodesulfurarchaeum sp. HSR-GB]MDR5657624.1 hypothetical protein [Halodesulfurarchaeum sp. HSR-GB]